jgi:acid phosphatase (class A)
MESARVRPRPRVLAAATLAVAAALAGCASFETAKKPAPVPEIAPGFLKGYLETSSLPNSAALLPPPPAAGSAAYAFDEDVSRKALALRGSSRWNLAAEDANLRFPQAAGTFSCALDTEISEQATPTLYLLLRRSLADAGISTSASKKQHNRPRPFLVNRDPICSPADEKFLASDGSYPSGHAAVGWAWALILATISPESTDALLARGLAFGESRVVCNVHWRSDVIEGRSMGAATVARLHADPAFRADLETAKRELAEARKAQRKPVRDCSAESAALAQRGR